MSENSVLDGVVSVQRLPTSVFFSTWRQKGTANGISSRKIKKKKTKKYRIIFIGIQNDISPRGDRVGWERDGAVVSPKRKCM